MKLLITGASGFLGQYVLTEAIRQGHAIRAIVRALPSADCWPYLHHSNVEFIELDLLELDRLSHVMQGIDAVIHLASAKTGSFDVQYRDTVLATESLITAMKDSHVHRLVAVSSFSVFDYCNTKAGSLINEESLLELNFEHRDGYAQTKIIQENLIRDFGQNHGAEITIIRPGALYGRDHLWTSRLGIRLRSNIFIGIGKHAVLPLSYVENCASAIIKAVSTENAIGEMINIVDDNLPTQQEYIKQLNMSRSHRLFTFHINWWLTQTIAQTVWQFGPYLFGKRFTLPGLLIPVRLHARFKPLQYSNSKARQILEWAPEYSLEEALARSLAETDYESASLN